MECWICKRPAHAVCVFCGKAVCQEHAQFKPSVKAVFKDEKGDLQAIVVDGGVWCGKCKPIEYPVNISGFEPTKSEDSSANSSETTDVQKDDKK